MNPVEFVGVYEDAAAWSRFWDGLQSLPLIDAPAVDFDTHRVAVIALGETRNTCTRVNIDAVVRDPLTNDIVVRYTQEAPVETPPSDRFPAAGPCHEAPTQPHAIVSFTGEGAVRFEANEVKPEIPEPPIFFGTVAKGAHSPVPGPVTKVVRDAKEWDDLRALISDDIEQDPGVGEFQMLLIALGHRDNTCANVAVKSITRTVEDGALVSYEEILPDTQNRCDHDDRDPYVVVFMDRVDDLTFEKSERRSVFGTLGAEVEEPSRLLASGNASTRVNHAGKGVEVITDEAAWATFWQSIANGTDAPAVDFARHRVAAYGFSNGWDCQRIEFLNVTRFEHQSALTLNLVIHEEGPDACEDPARNPWVVVEVGRSGGVGYFAKRVRAQ